MENEPVSPAGISLLNEQAEQSAKRKTRLDKGLEDTFPASDPVSVTHTATATGPATAPDGQKAALEAMRHDVDTLRHRLAAAASGAGRAARSEAEAIERRLQQAVTEKPLVTIGLVAAVSFILGTIHRSRSARGPW